MGNRMHVGAHMEGGVTSGPATSHTVMVDGPSTATCLDDHTLAQSAWGTWAGLPPRWRLHNSSIYARPPPGGRRRSLLAHTIHPRFRSQFCQSISMRILASASPLMAVRQSVGKAASARDVTQSYLRGLQSVEGKLQSFISVNAEDALAQAEAVDRRLAQGEVLPLAGVPIAIKVRGIKQWH